MTTIKIYLPSEEIRRFTIDNDNLATFEKLTSVISRAIPNYHPEMRISYQDQENDKIVVSSETEYQEMLSHLTLLQNGTLSLIKIWIADSNKPLFREGTVEVLHAYVHSEKSLVDVEKPIQDKILQAISRLFPDNKILPYHIPTYLQNVLSVKATGDAEAEVDVKVHDLYSAINSAAMELLDSSEQYALDKAKKLLESLQILQPDNADVYYNLACVESLSKISRSRWNF